jgi:curved DNA-binding protein CbpA
MIHGFQLDPHGILGVSPGASSQQIRDAYREKTKKHHPDHGGDEWAFRVVVRAYEILNSTPAYAREAPPSHATTPRPAAASGTERVRPGVQDKIDDPIKLVDVEILWLRFQVADLFELVGTDSEDRNLSGSIQITWPSAQASGATRDGGKDADIIRILDDVFDEMRVKTRVVSSRVQREGGKFVGWLSYPSGDRAWNAFKVLHESLKARSLGVRQWTRDMIIPRD